MLLIIVRKSVILVLWLDQWLPTGLIIVRNNVKLITVKCKIKINVKENVKLIISQKVCHPCPVARPVVPNLLLAMSHLSISKILTTHLRDT